MTAAIRRKASWLSALLVALLAGPVVAAQTIDFNEPRFLGDGVTLSPGDSALVMGGFSLTVVGRPYLDVFAIDDLLGKVGNQTPRLFANNDALVVLASVAGNPIDLLSVDFGGSYFDQRLRWADAIEVTGYGANGSVLATTSLGLERIAPDPQLKTFQFGSQFRGLSRVSFHGLGDVGPGRNNHEFVLDNLVVTQVPEPASYSLLLAGFGLLMWRSWRVARSYPKRIIGD